MLPFADWATAVIDRSAVKNNANTSDTAVAMVLEVFIEILFSFSLGN
jgi:hypothetical protein